MAGILSFLFGGKNKALDALNPAKQIISKSIPGLMPVADRQEMIGGNPFKPVGDNITSALGGDPNAGVLSPSLIPNPMNLIGATGDKAMDSPNPISRPLATPPVGDEIGVNTLTPPTPIPLPQQPVLEKPQYEERAMQPVNPSDVIRKEMERRQMKDFSKGGKDYDKDHNFWDVLRTAGLSAIQGLASGGIGGAIAGAGAGAIRGAFDRNADEKIGNQMHLSALQPQYNQAYGMEQERRKNDEQSAWNAERLRTSQEDDRRQAESARALEQYRLDTIAERQAQRESVALNTKMRTVASMANKMESFDPNDPRMGEMVKALGDVSLPVTARDAKKKIQLIQDADTGAWTLTLTDPVNGQQEVRPVVAKDGQQLVTTSTAKVAANAAGERQEKGFAHSERMVALRQEYINKGKEYQAKLDEIKATNDQNRKLQLQQEAAKIQQEAIRLRDQIKDE